MKKHGHLNRDIARVLASMGHTNSIVIADCGLPIPIGVECIDVSLALGVPRFASVLESILADFQCERAVFAQECQLQNPEINSLAYQLMTNGALNNHTLHPLEETNPIDLYPHLNNQNNSNHNNDHDNYNQQNNQSNQNSNNIIRISDIIKPTKKINVEFVSHLQFKLMCEDAHVIIRTGECTPFANVILYSGVVF